MVMALGGPSRSAHPPPIPQVDEDADAGVEPRLLGKRIKNILRDRRETNAWLAERADLSVSTISLLTRGIIKSPRVGTLRKIADALGVEPGILAGMPDWRSGANTIEGALLVPVVRLPVRHDGRRQQELGEMIPVPRSLLVGRDRLFAAIVDGGGMSPHIIIGDRVIFDPDATPIDGDVVLVQHRGVTLAGWYVAHQRVPARVDLADGTWLSLDEAQVQGVILHKVSTPPRRPSSP
jgi:transcriptional regulator with XRE-family HTH domain